MDDEELDIGNYFFDLPTTASRRNQYIYPSSSGPNALRVRSLAELDMPQGFIYSGERSPHWAKKLGLVLMSRPLRTYRRS